MLHASRHTIVSVTEDRRSVPEDAQGALERTVVAAAGVSGVQASTILLGIAKSLLIALLIIGNTALFFILLGWFLGATGIEEDDK